ncbi:L,D-transpeptidase family protein [Paracoccus aeridis]|uniref:L,D-transpeptidase family protein n=1 Tax=Paracoccus aeridis TaxID=1966466 RepID=UPI0010AB312D|nr:L,D-transpeptidase [Paracoccus aeridis]
MPLPRPTILRSSLAACLLLTTALPAAAQTARVAMTSQDIEMAEYTGGDLPAGQSALTARVQILLDRSGVSPGVVDGFKGGMSQSAILAFERGHGLPQDGIMDAEIWNLLHAYAAAPVTMDYTIVDADAEGLVDSIPADYAEKAAMTSQGYTSVVEKLGERFHMDDKFLAQLNPGAAFVPGETIRVTVPAKPIKAKVARIIVDKQTSRVAAYDANGRMVADYPATVGSGETPSPHGVHKVTAVALDPTYTYDPSKNFKQGDNDKVLVVPPGPNAPVGNVWIDLSEPTYGLHGTPTPSRLFVQQSHGCVRLTNWDARELAHMVQPGSTEVEFLAPGVTIADAAGANATMAGSRPPVPSVARTAGDLALPGAGALDAAVAQAIGAAAAPVTLVESQRPGVNPLRGAATASTPLPDMAAAETAPLPADMPQQAAGTEPMPLPGNVASGQAVPFELPPVGAPQAGVQVPQAGVQVPQASAPAPAAPQPATQVPQMAPGQLVIDPFATPVAVPQAPQAVPPADAGGLTLPPSMSDR